MSKFWKGVVLGAIAGGAISLFDRETRKNVIDYCQKTTGKVTYYAKHPQEAANQLKESTRKIRRTIEDVSEEVSFIAEKIDELKETTPKVSDFVKETKDAFLEDSYDVDIDQSQRR
ncbi:YtxH domain-containing protein [Niallia sp. Krafla_26]|uniref:YtxH domain-containing protein n=1 Tax=Niallia sp. Krafla_26 TaxID=3064703 RepID=UPI003D18314C